MKKRTKRNKKTRIIMLLLTLSLIVFADYHTGFLFPHSVRAFFFNAEKERTWGDADNGENASLLDKLLDALKNLFQPANVQAATLEEELTTPAPTAEPEPVLSPTPEPAYITIEYPFFCEDGTEPTYDFPSMIEQGGHTYTFTGIVEYKTTEALSVVCQREALEVRDISEIEDVLLYTSPFTGRSYALAKAYADISDMTVINIKVSETMTYSPSPETPVIPNHKIITYYNEVTGEDESTEGVLVSSGKSGNSYWQSGYDIKGLFTTTDDETDEWTLEGIGNISLAQDAAAPVWDNYEKDVLSHLALPSEKYRITGAAWDGDSYHNEEGLLCRNAVYNAEALVTGYTAEYEGTGQAYGYRAEVLYFAPADEVNAAPEDIIILNKINAVVKYEEYSTNTAFSTEDNHPNSRLYFETEASPNRDKALLNAYQNYNKDVVGILRIPATVLNHPIVQTPDDETYYLNRDLNGDANSHGVPFLSANSHLDKPGGNVIIFGHNIHLHTRDVFCDLAYYEELDYYKEHPIIETVSAAGTRKWLIFAYFLTDNADTHPFPYSDTTEFRSLSSFREYMEEAGKRNWLDPDINVSYGDTLLTLSSCSLELAGSGTNRMVVMAKLLEDGENYETIVANAGLAEEPLLPERLR